MKRRADDKDSLVVCPHIGSCQNFKLPRLEFGKGGIESPQPALLAPPSDRPGGGFSLPERQHGGEIAFKLDPDFLFRGVLLADCATDLANMLFSSL